MPDQVSVVEKIESSHQWIDAAGQLQSRLLRADRGDMIVKADLEAEGVGDVDRWFAKLMDLGVAVDGTIKTGP